MEIKNSTPKLLVRLKNIQLVFDYCLENKIKFSVSPRLTPDEWEIELNMVDVMSAIALGIFVRENKIEVMGLNYATPKIQTATVNKIVKPSKSATGKKTDLMDELQVDMNSSSDIESSEEDNLVILQNKTELAF